MRPADGAAGTPDALVAWATGNGRLLDERPDHEGALLLRGFRVESPEAFRAVAAAIRLELGRYVGGDSPRSAVGDRVYASTEFPPELETGLHDELSYTRAWPERLFSCCLVAPRIGGETPIADGRRVLREMGAAARAACRRAELVFPWPAGDVLVLDNVLVMHGRNPFEGERRVLVAMA